MNDFQRAVARPAGSAIEINKVLRNTYALLSMTLVFSAIMAAVSMAMNVPPGASLLSSLAAIGLLWFVVPRFANSAAGIGLVFLTTGLLGFGLGPILSMYLAMPNGPGVVMTAMGGTGAIFLGLSGYVLVTKKELSFMGGMLVTGIIAAFVLGIVAMLFSMPMLSLAVSGIFVLLMSGMIMYQTSAIIHGGETNYIMATVSLYVAIYNLFLSLLHLLGALAGER
jgi:modulator of FtsH protease